MVVIVVIIAGLTTLLIIGIINKSHKSRIAKERIKSFPLFSFRKLNDTIFRSDEIKEGPVLVLFFHPECEHCQYQITTLFKNWVEPSGVHVILISNAEKEIVKKFVNKISLPDSPEIIILVDDTYSFLNYFGTELVPATFIYDRKLRLIKYFQGEVRSETILKYLKQDD